MLESVKRFRRWSSVDGVEVLDLLVKIVFILGAEAVAVGFDEDLDPGE